MIEVDDDSKEIDESWKQHNYVIGSLAGVLVGLLAAYLFNRAAEEDIEINGKPTPLKSGQMISLSLALLGLIRQITEMGKPDKK